VDSASCGRLINEFRAEYQGADETPPLLDHSQMDVRTKCPACHDPMEVHPYYGPGNAVIDSCMHCKLVWFNAGELDRIIKAPGLRQQLIRCEVSTRIEPAAFMDSSAQDLDRGSTALDFAATLFQALIR
jgi:Zn-finger nucleic acid-binding protein